MFGARICQTRCDRTGRVKAEGALASGRQIPSWYDGHSSGSLRRDWTSDQSRLGVLDFEFGDNDRHVRLGKNPGKNRGHLEGRQGTLFDPLPRGRLAASPDFPFFLVRVQSRLPAS